MSLQGNVALVTGASRGIGAAAKAMAVKADARDRAQLEAMAATVKAELGLMGIRVNAVAPGLTLTDATANIPENHKQAAAAHTPLRRNGQAEDVAEAVVGILQSRFVTGTTLPVNGGGYLF